MKEYEVKENQMNEDEMNEYEMKEKYSGFELLITMSNRYEFKIKDNDNIYSSNYFLEKFILDNKITVYEANILFMKTL